VKVTVGTYVREALTDDGVDVPAAVYVGQSVVERRAGLEVVAAVDHYVIHDVTRDVTSYMTSHATSHAT